MTDEEQRAWQVYYDEACDAPMGFVVHDTNAAFDDRLRDLAAERGWAFYGMWWRLVEILTAKHGHCYDVSTEKGLSFLALDMSSFQQTTCEDVSQLLKSLAEVGLIDRAAYEERGHVISKRVLKNVEEYAKRVAKGKLAAWKTNSRRHSTSGNAK